MKKILILSIALITIDGFAQDALVKVSPFHFFDGTFYASYERALENNRSIQLDGGLRLADDGNDFGWMGELQLRKYLFSSKFAGKSILSGFMQVYMLMESILMNIMNGENGIQL